MTAPTVGRWMPAEEAMRDLGCWPQNHPVFRSHKVVVEHPGGRLQRLMAQVNTDGRVMCRHGQLGRAQHIDGRVYIFHLTEKATGEDR